MSNSHPILFLPFISVLSLEQKDLHGIPEEESNLGTLNIFSHELLDEIFEYLVSDVEDLIRGLRVSWDFWDVIMGVRSSARNPLVIGEKRAILSPFFRLFPNIRHVQGSILLSTRVSKLCGSGITIREDNGGLGYTTSGSSILC